MNEAQETEWQALKQRVEKLERNNRRLNLLGAVGGVLAAALLIRGQAAPPKIVEANEFILRDASGKKRADLSIVRGGFGVPLSALQLFDPAGNTRALLEASEGESRLELSGARGNPRALLSATDDGSHLLLFNQRRFETYIGEDDLVTPYTGETPKTPAASIVLFDKDHKVIWRAP